MKHWLWTLVVLLVLSVVGTLGWLAKSLYTPYQGFPGTSVEVEIPSGAGLGLIASRLAEQGVIPSKTAFYWAARLTGRGTGFKHGLYRLEGRHKALEVMDILQEGREQLVKVTIPEGTRMRDIFALFEAAGVKNEGRYDQWSHNREFIASLGLPETPVSLEGFLFPETYLVSRKAEERTILKSMVQMFKTKLPPDYEAQARAVGLSWYEAITLASIVEKETGRVAEQPTVASVFHNRLKKGMRLQTDPTVIYGVADYKGNITKKHLTTFSPYNTYLIPGLPPTPIANPGLGALQAVVHPAVTAYLYFVGKGDGSHLFSTNFKDHDQAVTDFQRRRRTDYHSY